MTRGEERRATRGEARAPALLPGGRGLAARLLRAVRLDRSVFREVDEDPRAIGQAALVVLAGGLAQMLGTAHLWPFDDTPLTAADTATNGLASLVSWLVPTAVVWWVGVRLLRARAAFPAVLRAVGFSSAPQLLYLLSAGAAVLGGGAALEWSFAALAWVLTQAALFVAVQQSLGMTATRALVTFAIAGVATALLGLALATVLPAALWQPLVL